MYLTILKNNLQESNDNVSSKSITYIIISIDCSHKIIYWATNQGSRPKWHSSLIPRYFTQKMNRVKLILYTYSFVYKHQFYHHLSMRTVGTSRTLGQIIMCFISTLIDQTCLTCLSNLAPKKLFTKLYNQSVGEKYSVSEKTEHHDNLLLHRF